MTCPHAGGAKNWLPDSYNPDSHVLFVSLVEACMDLLPVPPGGRGSLSTGVRWALRPRPDSDGKYGRVQAINIETKKTMWMERQRAPMSTGVLATAGGVVFAGAIDRGFSAYDDATGKELWHTRLNDVPSSAPMTYIVNGQQYIALVIGNGGAQAATFPALVPEIKNPPGSRRDAVGVRATQTLTAGYRPSTSWRLLSAPLRGPELGHCVGSRRQLERHPASRRRAHRAAAARHGAAARTC